MDHPHQQHAAEHFHSVCDDAQHCYSAADAARGRAWVTWATAAEITGGGKRTGDFLSKSIAATGAGRGCWRRRGLPRRGRSAGRRTGRADRRRAGRWGAVAGAHRVAPGAGARAALRSAGPSPAPPPRWGFHPAGCRDPQVRFLGNLGRSLRDLARFLDPHVRFLVNFSRLLRNLARWASHRGRLVRNLIRFLTNLGWFLRHLGRLFWFWRRAARPVARERPIGRTSTPAPSSRRDET
jgi:hypothetical protein